MHGTCWLRMLGVRSRLLCLELVVGPFVVASAAASIAAAAAEGGGAVATGLWPP